MVKPCVSFGAENYTSVFPRQETDILCKVNSDGSHFIARKKVHSFNEPGKPRKKTVLDNTFENLYSISQKLNHTDGERVRFIRDNIMSEFPMLPDDERENFLKSNFARKSKNLYARKKRFRRKIALYSWNYFVTFTYDGKKHDAETFRAKLKKCFSNLSTRRGWKVAGAFEYSPEKERLHFHAAVYIPKGQMVGKLDRIATYSKKKHKRTTYIENSFFRSRFGVNSFEKIDNHAVKRGQNLEYLLKYIEKSGERLFYSRGTKEEIEMYVSPKDIAAHFFKFGERYVLFDDHFILSNLDVIEWENNASTNPYDPVLLE